MPENIRRANPGASGWNLKDFPQLIGTIAEYLRLQQMYSGGIKEIVTKLEILDDNFRVQFDHNPIHHMEHRLKSPQSILEKLARKELPFNPEAIRQNLTDVAGVRVICNYVGDIYRIAELLTRQDDVTLVREKDYIKQPKPNGYRSLHLVVTVPVFLTDKTESVPVEIQIRTIAMDFWASLEHQLKYKSTELVSEELRARLTECAEQSAELDLKMQAIYHELHGDHETESGN